MKTGVSCSGVILAGGLSSRFQGKNKAFFKLDGRSVIDPIIDVFQSVFEDILIVTNAPRQYLQYDATLVSDVYDVRSSLTGIHAGLFYARHPHIGAIHPPRIETDDFFTIHTSGHREKYYVQIHTYG